MTQKQNKHELFARAPVGKALYTMAIPTVISQLVSLIYNMVDAFFIGRTGNSYMMAATTVTLTLTMMNAALSNLFGIGGGSQMARLMGAGKDGEARSASAFSAFAAAGLAALYASLTGIFLNPVLRFLGASDATIHYARTYTLIVIVAGGIPSILSLTLAHLLRSAGYSTQASIGLSGGGILNALLDPLFMFVLLPAGQEVTGAAIATALSNTIACIYLICACLRAGKDSPVSLHPRHAAKAGKKNIRSILNVGIPSALLTGLFDLANICLNINAAGHSDLVLAGMGIVMKVERLPNAINLGICQGMLPIVAYNWSSGSHDRMNQVIRLARNTGLIVSACSIVLFETFAGPLSRLFLSTSGGDPQTALTTLGWAALFLRIRCAASPVQMLNYHTSFCMQAMGKGKATMLHAFVRELVFYIPFMFLFDRLFGEVGLACALIAGEGCGAAFALYLLKKTLRDDAGSMRQK